MELTDKWTQKVLPVWNQSLHPVWRCGWGWQSISQLPQGTCWVCLPACCWRDIETQGSNVGWGNRNGIRCRVLCPETDENSQRRPWHGTESWQYPYLRLPGINEFPLQIFFWRKNEIQKLQELWIWNIPIKLIKNRNVHWPCTETCPWFHYIVIFLSRLSHESSIYGWLYGCQR